METGKLRLLKTMKRGMFICVFVVAVAIIAFAALRRGGEPTGNEGKPPAAQRGSFNAETFTDPTSKFFAELANYLIKKTR